MFILVELALAIVFVCTNFTHASNVAAVFEWIVAFVFTFYILGFLLDLLPSVQTRHHRPQGWKNELERVSMSEADGRHADGEYTRPLTSDSAGPNSNL